MTAMLTGVVLAVLCAVSVSGTGMGTDAMVEAEVRVGMSVEMELDSLAGVYGLAEVSSELEAAHEASKPPKVGTKDYAMAKNMDASIKSSKQEQWGCCRVCDDLNELVQKIPPKKEYDNLTMRDKRRHIAPERGFDDWKSPLISCCPTCIWPLKADPTLSAPPTVHGDMDTEMSIYSRGDGPTDDDAVAGAVENERAGEFAKFDAENKVRPSKEFIRGYQKRARARNAKKLAVWELRRATKHGTAEEIKAAREAMKAYGFVELDSELDLESADATVEPQYVDAEADGVEGEELGADMRHAQKFKLGKALKKVGKAAVKGLKKVGKKIGKFVKNLFGGGKHKNRRGGAGAGAGADAAGGAAQTAQAAGPGPAGGAAQQAQTQKPGGAPGPRGGSLRPPSGMQQAIGRGPNGAPIGQQQQQQQQAAGAPAPPPPPPQAAATQQVRRAAVGMTALPPAAKPWNPLRDTKGDLMIHTLVGDPLGQYQDLGGGEEVEARLAQERKPTGHLPPCCNMCGVNNGPHITSRKRVSTCCYYCVRKHYETKPARERLRVSSRPLPKAKPDLDALAKQLAKENSIAQDDNADIFSPRPPMLRANRDRFRD